MIVTGTALLTAPSLGALDEAACQAVAAVLRQRMEIANLAETHSTQSTVETVMTPWAALPSTASAHQQRDRQAFGRNFPRYETAAWRSLLRGNVAVRPRHHGYGQSLIGFRPAQRYPSARMIGLSGAWQTASMR